MTKKILTVLLLTFTLCFNVYAVEKPQLSCKSAVLIDVESGKVIYDYNMNKQLPQASITKLMTYYVFKDFMKNSTYREDSIIKMGDIKGFNLPKDSAMSGIKSGEEITLGQLFDALLIISGNDCAEMLKSIYVSEGKDMIADMNKKAKEIGLKSSNYVNVSGLTTESNITKEYNVTTAYETAILGKSILATYPEILRITSKKDFFHKDLKLNNTNKLLLDKDLNVDGLKTGHTSEAGYCLISTEIINNEKNGKPFRFIGVVLGSPSDEARVLDSKKILNYGEEIFTYEKLSKLINDNEEQFVVSNEYYKGGVIKGAVPEDAYVPKLKDYNIKYNILFDTKLPRKIKKGEKIGTIVVVDEVGTELEYNLVASQDYKSVSFLKRLILYIKHLLKFLR